MPQKKIKLYFCLIFFLTGCSLSNFNTKPMPNQLANPASTYCIEQGGTIEMRETKNDTAGFCLFSDGSICDEWQFFRQECSPSSAKKITNFEECVQANNPILESSPRQCHTANGDIFIEDLNTTGAETICQNKCGDGLCQEIVCLGSHCPCVENNQACPQDCQ